MRYAKPSDKDIDAACSLMQLLNSLGSYALDGVPDFFTLLDDGDFDQDNIVHLQSLFNKLVTLMHKNPSFHNRVIGGMCFVIMYSENQIIDPDSDHLEMHPRFKQMISDLARETQAARYWNKLYHQAIEARDQACLDAPFNPHWDLKAAHRASILEYGEMIHNLELEKKELIAQLAAANKKLDDLKNQGPYATLDKHGSLQVLAEFEAPPGTELYLHPTLNHQMLIGHWNSSNVKFAAVSYVDGLVRGSLPEGTPIYADRSKSTRSSAGGEDAA